MATLANLFNRFMEAGSVIDTAAETAYSHDLDRYRLRPLPNEDVYFYIKRIDNSRVVREADPGARAKSWRFLGASVLAAGFLICMLLPSAYGLIAGYQLHQLQTEHDRLLIERGRLELEEEKLVTPEKLAEYAQRGEFTPPKAANVVYLSPANDESLALNRH